jgi:hypothetical protein
MEMIEVEAFPPLENWAVVRLPGRTFPGVVMQGDSMSSLVLWLRDAETALGHADVNAATDLIALALDTLEEVRRGYEAMLEANDIGLPYAPISD